MSRKTRRRFIAAVGAVAAIAAAGFAIAYFTDTGNGTGSATVGSSTAWGVSVTGSPTFTPSGYTAIYPGAGSEVIPFTITNNGKGYQNLANLSYSIKNDGGTPALAETSAGTVISGCQASWFSASADGSNASLPSDIAPAGTYTGKVDVAMSDSGTNQDACQGKSPGVVVSAS
jgi:hypothetical protein